MSAATTRCSWTLSPGSCWRTRPTASGSRPTSTECSRTLACRSPVRGRIKAIGTAGMRRREALAATLQDVCNAHGIEYRTISQREEAELLRPEGARLGHPLPSRRRQRGGGSIQIVATATHRPILLPFGISDLNRAFRLRRLPGAVRRRLRALGRTAASVAARRLAYAGGERCTSITSAAGCLAATAVAATSRALPRWLGPD